jgi:hypothetical protein
MLGGMQVRQPIYMQNKLVRQEKVFVYQLYLSFLSITLFNDRNPASLKIMKLSIRLKKHVVTESSVVGKYKFQVNCVFLE